MMKRFTWVERNGFGIILKNGEDFARTRPYYAGMVCKYFEVDERDSYAWMLCF